MRTALVLILMIAMVALSAPDGQAQAPGCIFPEKSTDDDAVLPACNKIISEHLAGKAELANAYANRAVINLDKKRTREALQDADQAIALDPSNASPHTTYARAYWQDKAYDKSKAEFASAIALAPDHFFAYYLRSAMLVSLDQFAEAASDADKAKTLAPAYADAWNIACWTRALWDKDLETALSDCDRAISLTPEKSPSRGNFLDSRCLVKFRMKKYEDAIQDCDAAYNITRHIGSLYVRGLARMNAGMRGPGSDDMTRARSVDRRLKGFYAKYGIGL